MTDPTPHHARPGLSVEERAARVELALAQADRGEDRRRIVREAIVAAVAQQADDAAFARFVVGDFHD